MSQRKQFLPLVLSRSLSEPTPIPPSGRAAAAEILEYGGLSRYGQAASGEDHASLLEAEFASWLGRRFAVAMSSGGATLFAALRCLDVQPGEPVLFNAFTLAPVPGAIGHAGALPVPVEITADYTIDCEDLVVKAQSSGARVLMLSHMRGHMADMDRVVAICRDLGLYLVEDCAHTLGAQWAGRGSGTFGVIGCFSTQSNKHINSGEGGILVTDDEDIAARSILLSGSYGFYDQHHSRPDPDVFDRWRGTTPNCSLRMPALAAALLRPQLSLVDVRARLWNERYAWLVSALDQMPRVWIPPRDDREQFVASSLQFNVRGFSGHCMRRFVAGAGARGVSLKWFGETQPAGFISSVAHWQYIDHSDALANTAAVLAGLCDMRIPLTLTAEECEVIASIIEEELNTAASDSPT